MQRRATVLTVVLTTVFMAGAAPAAEVFDLGVIDVEARPLTEALTPPVDTVRVDPHDVRHQARPDVTSTLRFTPGVAFRRSASRNETNVAVRGFDLRQVPVLVDGIPVYVPYDGTIDLGRFTTFDLGAVEVSKGVGSVLYGPNTLGGAINLVTRRPTERFEGDAGLRLVAGDGLDRSGFETWFNVGSRQERWWYQVSSSLLRRDDWPLSGDFVPSTILNAGRPLEDGGTRENSRLEDFKLNLKVGRIFDGTNELTVNLIDQSAEKNVPPYAGSLPGVRANFWRAPYYDKRSLYVIGRWQVGRDRTLKSRLYYDTFDNALYAYDDSTYSTQTGSRAFQSIYDDYTIGGSHEFAFKPTERDELRVGFTHKQDVHRDRDLLEPTQPELRFEDDTFSFGVENTHQADARWALTYGTSLELRRTVRADDYQDPDVVPFPRASNRLMNPRIMAEYQLAPGRKAFVGVAKKSRFPTLKDRFSYRFGSSLPNPGLGPETSINYEAGICETRGPSTELRASIFHNDIRDYYQQVPVAPDVTQLQNVGEVYQNGVEVSLERRLGWRTEYGAALTLLERKNEAVPAVVILDVPRSLFNAHVTYRPSRRLSCMLNLEVASERWSQLNAQPTAYLREVGAAATLDLAVTWEPNDRTAWSVGVLNLTDKNYELNLGYPEPGRQYTVAYLVRF